MAGARVFSLASLIASVVVGVLVSCAPVVGRAQSDPSSQGSVDLHEAAALHRQLLELAELEQARGSLAEGVAAAEAALRLAERGGEPGRILASRAVLGNLLAAMGEGARARRELDEVVARARALALPELADAARIQLAQLDLSDGRRESARAGFEQVEAEASARGDTDTASIALLNGLRLDVSASEPMLEAARASRAESQLAALPESAARGLRLAHLGRTFVLAAEREIELRARWGAAADRVLRRALEVADALPDDDRARRVRAEALGTLASLYALDERLAEALALTQRALRIAAASDVELEAYPWHVQAGELHRRVGERDAALAAWARALELADRHRAVLMRGAASAGSGIGSDLSPLALGRRYVDLLLERARTRGDEPGRRADLLLAQSALERLKSDELRDYFEDECVARARAKRVSLEEAAGDAIIVYPFILDERLELLVSAGNALHQVVVDVSRAELQAEVEAFRSLLEKRTTQQYRQSARQLHRWLVDPIAEILARQPDATLVFVPDGILRTIPMAALHDGERFLIERHAVATTPGLELSDPRPFDRAKPAALLVGLSTANAGFERLEYVEKEIRQIHEITGGDVLLDEAFSPSALTKKLEQKSFQLLHVASHASFGEQTGEPGSEVGGGASDGGFLLTHDGPLAFDALADAIGAGQLRDDALELVVFSACETAEGSERAALGLSGMAVRAGARSAIGSLWRVHDEATARFMATFYRALAVDGRSRGDAVRAAQLELLGDPSYRHPYFWSPFLLISSWH